MLNRFSLLKEKCDICGPYAMTVIRVVLGIIFIMHGGQKVLGWFGGQGLTATVDMMVQSGLPKAAAYAVCLGELLGGLGLLVGCLTRIAALGIFIIMAGAVGVVHFKSGFFASNGGYEYPLALAAMALSIVFGGGGALSLDQLCCCKKDSCAA